MSARQAVLTASTGADRKLVSFANEILGDWDEAMDAFFTRIERLARDRDLTTEQIRESLDQGYGEDVGDSWIEWSQAQSGDRP